MACQVKKTSLVFLVALLAGLIILSPSEETYAMVDQDDRRANHFMGLYDGTLGTDISFEELPPHLQERLTESGRPYSQIKIYERAPITYVVKYSDGENIFGERSGRWKGSWEFLGDNLVGINPTCEAPPFGYDEFRALFERSDINSKEDFLRALPSDVLQRFTFITTSESLQKEGVDYHNPRVLRFSADADFSMTYTCDNSLSSGHSIEVLFFDKKQNRYNFVHAQFPDPTDESGLLGRTKKTLTINHRSCLACHAGYDPRPNWAQYQTWKGTMGSVDDMLFDSDSEYEKADRFEESKNLQDLRVSRSGQACIDTLPFPKEGSDEFAHKYYPYVWTGNDKPNNYRFRPNAQFTVAQDRLNARRLARKFLEHPIYHRLKELIVADAMACDFMKDRTELDFLNEKLDHYTLEYMNRSYVPRHYARTNTYEKLVRLSSLLGFYGSDWHLHFDHKTKRTINEKRVDESGHEGVFSTQVEYSHHFLQGQTEDFHYYHAGNWRTPETVFGVLVKELSEEYPEMKPHMQFLNWWENVFGEGLKCLDENASKYWFDRQRDQAICEILKDKIQRKTITPVTQAELSQAHSEYRSKYQFEEAPRPVVTQVNSDAGKRILQTTCGACHDGQVLNFNFLDHSQLKLQLGHEPFDLRLKVETYLGAPDTCTMPIAAYGKCLSDNERESVLKYLDELK